MAKPGGTKNPEHYHQLQARYGAALPGRITEIEQLWQQIMASAAYSDLAQQLRRHIHSIAGSAGTFGFSQMSEVAREFDALLYRCLNQDSNLKTGADDFIEKPVADEALVLITATRARRFRTLSALMHRDSMTQLHNHSAIKLKLEVELGLATRTKRPLSFVMIDIDHFKQVNDSYGHLAGDRVIRGLALMLGQRLRKSDFIGRYGGEEFGIIMPDTTLLQAEEVINELREQFSTIKFPALSNLNCTFSAGIADASMSSGRDDMIAAADNALYAAKKNGRNQVVIAKGNQAQQDKVATRPDE